MVVELLTFLGLALLLEGVIMALFPTAMRRMLDQFAALAPQQLRVIGLGFAVAAALALVILARLAEGSDGAGMSFAFPLTRGFVAALF